MFMFDGTTPYSVVLFFYLFFAEFLCVELVENR